MRSENYKNKLSYKTQCSKIRTCSFLSCLSASSLILSCISSCCSMSLRSASSFFRWERALALCLRSSSSSASKSRSCFSRPRLFSSACSSFAYSTHSSQSLGGFYTLYIWPYTKLPTCSIKQ